MASNNNTITNAGILELFSAAARYYNLRGDEWRARAYSTAVETLARVDVIGLPLADLAAMRGIGKSILGLIEEYRSSGKIECIQRLFSTPEYRAWETLSRVTGAGPATVGKWIAAGLRNPTEVLAAAKKGAIKITSMQNIGLTYYDDLSARIPRDEVTAIVTTIACASRDVMPTARVVPAGSYRRMKADSGDVDILVVTTAPTLEAILMRVEVMRPVVRIIVGPARISFLIKAAADSSNKKLNVGATHNLWRQVDLLLVRPENYWPALLYFTGGAEHVRGIRALCQAKGMRLNQDGLFKMVATSVKYPQGLMPIPLQSERDLYDILGLEYVPPEHR